MELLPFLIRVCPLPPNSKTNVAMLTVVAHLRNVGLIKSGSSEITDAAKKIVYIAPMKALAQEVVEKFSSKLKPLGLVVRELTGDMQLTRAAAEAANILVTTPEKWDGMFPLHEQNAWVDWCHHTVLKTSFLFRYFLTSLSQLSLASRARMRTHSETNVACSSLTRCICWQTSVEQ